MSWKNNLTELLNAHSKFEKKVTVSERYYKNETDITLNESDVNAINPKKSGEDPLRQADNRIPHNYHEILTNQEASYAFSIPPVFDVDDKKLNEDISEALGNEDELSKEAKDLCVDAVNAGIAWCHVWIDEEDGSFQYASVNPKNVIPIYSKHLKKRLSGLIHKYADEVDGDKVTVFEYWDKNQMERYYKKNEDGAALIAANDFNIIDNGTGEVVESTNVYPHEWGEIPFVPFPNNNVQQPNLDKYKKHIDIYDKVYSGFVNDIDDVQEIILILTNYGGADLQEFKSDLNKFKTIKVESNGSGDNSGVDSLAIDIPVEARNKLLEMTKEQIYESGQGVNPHREVGNASSGVALKQIYSMLELKVGFLETEFRLGFTKLIGFVLKYLGKDPKQHRVRQTWTRTRIDNETELAEIVDKLAKHTSKENVAKANPIVDDWENELALQSAELEEAMRHIGTKTAQEDYRNEEAEKAVELDG